MQILQKLLALTLLITSVAVIYAAWLYPTPSAVRHIHWLLPAIVLTSASLILLSLIMHQWFSTIGKTIWKSIIFIASIPILFILLQSYQFYSWKKTIASVNESDRHKLGQHFIIGYQDKRVIKELATLGMIGGIYITKANVIGKSRQQIKQEIEDFQQIRQVNKLPPLIITTDQEGGIVSRLSPPLPRYSSLGKTVKNFPAEEQAQAAFDYGRQQGKELTSIGINVNLSPVIDLTPKETSPSDKYSLIYRRAISNSADEVSEIALQYIKGLECSGITATLKHFPGLGKVYGDTHIQGVHLTASIEELEQSDWKPFRKIIKSSHALTMIGHVNIDAIDKDKPASISHTVLDTIIRKKWQHQGVLITDDLTMDAIYKIDNNHLQTASTEALNAGIDLLLISFDARQFYPAFANLIKQHKNNEISDETLNESQKRITVLLEQLGTTNHRCTKN